MIKNRFKQLWSDKFVRGTFILSAGTMLGSVFTFLVHPVLSRYLSVAEYGDFQAFLSFITILGIVGAVIKTVATREVAVMAAENPAAIKVFKQQASWRLSVVGLILFILISLFSFPLGGLFQISRPSLLIIVTLFLLYVFPLTINRSVLAGRQFFPPLAAINISESLFRFLLVLVLVAGFSSGIVGAAWALGLTGLPAFFLSFYLIKKKEEAAYQEVSTSDPSSGPEPLYFSWRLLGSYALLVLWFTALSQFFYNFDMLFVKAHFSPDEAGLYGALLTVGRIIFFVGGSVPLVMFPVIAGLKNDLSPRRFFVLLKSLGLMALLVGPACLVIALWPEFMIRLVVGAKYLSVAPYLPLFSLVILFLTMMTVLSQYFLALAKRRGLIVLSFGAVAEIVFLTFFRADFWQIIWSLILVFGLVNLTLIALLLYEYLKSRKNGKKTDETVSHDLSDLSGLNQGIV